MFPIFFIRLYEISFSRNFCGCKKLKVYGSVRKKNAPKISNFSQIEHTKHALFERTYSTERFENFFFWIEKKKRTIFLELADLLKNFFFFLDRKNNFIPIRFSSAKFTKSKSFSLILKSSKCNDRNDEGELESRKKK